MTATNNTLYFNILCTDQICINFITFDKVQFREHSYISSIRDAIEGGGGAAYDDSIIIPAWGTFEGMPIAGLAYCGANSNYLYLGVGGSGDIPESWYAVDDNSLPYDDLGVFTDVSVPFVSSIRTS